LWIPVAGFAQFDGFWVFDNVFFSLFPGYDDMNGHHRASFHPKKHVFSNLVPIVSSFQRARSPRDIFGVLCTVLDVETRRKDAAKTTI